MQGSSTFVTKASSSVSAAALHLRSSQRLHPAIASILSFATEVESILHFKVYLVT